MVYCGKPSKGCAPCRIKRTKCGQEQPSCQQCLRTGRACYGYRFVTGWEFLDQTKDVANKQSALNTEKPSPVEIQQGTENSLMPRTPRPINTMPTRVPPVIPPGADDLAAGCFFNYYALPHSATKRPRRLHSWLPDLYAKSPARSALSSTIVALGISIMSRSLKSPSLMLQANAKYVEVLNMVHSALSDPATAKLDNTLTVVILLGLYEENNPTTISLDPWTHHVQGALMLLDYRGDSQLQEPQGLAILRAQRMATVANCLVRQAMVPQSMLKWSRLAREYETGDELAESELADHFAEFCQLQADMASCIDYSDPTNILARALNIEAELASWAAKWQMEEPYASIVAQESSPDLFSDHWHFYHDIFVADVWNNYHSIRINTNELIIKQIGILSEFPPISSMFQCSPDYENQFEVSKQTITKLSSQICAALPYFLGRLPNNNTNVESLYNLKNASRAKLILWPLYVAGQSSFISDIMRVWIADQLEKIAESMGIRSAWALSRLVRSKQRVPEKRWRDLISVTK